MDFRVTMWLNRLSPHIYSRLFNVKLFNNTFLQNNYRRINCFSIFIKIHQDNITYNCQMKCVISILFIPFITLDDQYKTIICMFTKYFFLAAQLRYYLVSMSVCRLFTT